MVDALNWLKINNPLHNEMSVSNHNIDSNAKNVQQNYDISENTLKPINQRRSD